MTRRGFVTEKTHSPDGSKTMSQINREAEALRDAQPMVTSCSIHLCDWMHTGNAAEGRDAFLEHRRVEHPTADRVARNEAARGSDRERAEAAAEERRQKMALRALDDGESQTEAVGREPQAETFAGGDDVAAPESATSTDTPSPGPATAAAETGSRPLDSWSRKKKTPDEIVASIKTVAEIIGRAPSRDAMQKHGGVSSKAAARAFGSWENALKAAGFSMLEAGAGSRKWTRETAIAKLQEVVAELDRLPLSTETGLGLPGSWSFHKLFGSWGDYLEAAGFEKPGKGPRQRSAPEERQAADRTGIARSRHAEAEAEAGQPGSTEPVAAAGRAPGGLLELHPNLLAGETLGLFYEQLSGEADRLERRATAFRKIAEGIQLLHETQERAA